MKTPGRSYDMTSRARAAEETGRRILEAMHALFGELPYPRITLEMVAQRSGVTLQTVLRRFGSKEGLLAAAAADAQARIEAQRAEAPVGDVAGAMRVLFDHYEEWGRVSLRLLSQEEALPEIAPLTRAGRGSHVAWVDAVFAPFLRELPGARRDRLRHQLVAVTDVYMWKILRVDRGLSRRSAERALTGMAEALLGTGPSV